MSEFPLGPGWWIAPDGRWYAPEQHPGAANAPAADPGQVPLIARSGQPSGPQGLSVAAALSYLSSGVLSDTPTLTRTKRIQHTLAICQENFDQRTRLLLWPRLYHCLDTVPTDQHPETSDLSVIVMSEVVSLLSPRRRSTCEAAIHRTLSSDRGPNDQAILLLATAVISALCAQSIETLCQGEGPFVPLLAAHFVLPACAPFGKDRTGTEVEQLSPQALVVLDMPTENLKTYIELGRQNGIRAKKDSLRHMQAAMGYANAIIAAKPKLRSAIPMLDSAVDLTVTALTSYQEGGPPGREVRKANRALDRTYRALYDSPRLRAGATTTVNRRVGFKMAFETISTAFSSEKGDQVLAQVRSSHEDAMDLGIKWLDEIVAHERRPSRSHPDEFHPHQLAGLRGFVAFAAPSELPKWSLTTIKMD